MTKPDPINYKIERYNDDDTEYRRYNADMEAWQKSAEMLSCGFFKHHAEMTPKNDCASWRAVFDRLMGLVGDGKKNSGFMGALIGDRGLGKTQMACEIAKRYLVRPIVYTTAVRFFRTIRSTWNRDSQLSETQALKPFELSEFLIIDEIAEIRGDSNDRMLLTDLVDFRYGNKKSTLFIGNIKPESIAQTLGDSIASRINERGGIIELKGETFRK